MCTSSRYWNGFIVGKVPSPGGSESQVPSIQERGSITGFNWGVSAEEEERMKTFCGPALQLAVNSWLEEEHETPQKWPNASGTLCSRAKSAPRCKESKSVFRPARGLPQGTTPGSAFLTLSSTNPKGKSPPFDTQERRSLKSQGKE